MPSFKVPCPSCETQVLIKSEKQIGTKTECPKCKYRFKVEAPGAETVPDEAPVAEGGPVEDEAVEDEAGAEDEAAASGTPGAAA